MIAFGKVILNPKGVMITPCFNKEGRLAAGYRVSSPKTNAGTYPMAWPEGPASGFDIESEKEKQAVSPILGDRKIKEQNEIWPKEIPEYK